MAKLRFIAVNPDQQVTELRTVVQKANSGLDPGQIRASFQCDATVRETALARDLPA